MTPEFLTRIPSIEEGFLLEALTKEIEQAAKKQMPYEELVNAILTVAISVLPQEDSDYTINKMMEATQAAAHLCGVEFDYGMLEIPNNKDIH